MAKNKNPKYEMILAWSNNSKPFVLQKLWFYAPPVFKTAYLEAVSIKNLLRRAGNHKPGDVKIMAFGYAGIMSDYNKENGILAIDNIKAINKITNDALNMKLNGKAKPKPQPSKHNGKISIR